MPNKKPAEAIMKSKPAEAIIKSKPAEAIMKSKAPAEPEYFSFGQVPFAVSRLLAICFFLANASVLAHVDAFFGCEALLDLPLNGKGWMKDLLIVGLWVSWTANGLLAVAWHWIDAHARTILGASAFFYLGLNYLAGPDLFLRDYDMLLVEATLVFACLGYDTFACQGMLMALFRFCFQFAATALYGLHDMRMACLGLWSGKWLAHGYEFAESGTLVWYLRYYSFPGVCRGLTWCFLLGFLVCPGVLILLGPGGQAGCVSRQALLGGVFVAGFLYFVAFQTFGWMPLLLLAILAGAAERNWLFSLSLLKSMGYKATSVDESEEAVRRAEDDVAGVFVAGVGVLAVFAFGCVTEFGLLDLVENRMELRDFILTPILYITCLAAVVRLGRSLKSVKTMSQAGKCVLLLLYIAATGGSYIGAFYLRSTEKRIMPRFGGDLPYDALESGTLRAAPSRPRLVNNRIMSTPSSDSKASEITPLVEKFRAAAEIAGKITPVYGKDFFCPNSVYVPANAQKGLVDVDEARKRPPASSSSGAGGSGSKGSSSKTSSPTGATAGAMPTGGSSVHAARLPASSEVMERAAEQAGRQQEQAGEQATRQEREATPGEKAAMIQGVAAQLSREYTGGASRSEGPKTTETEETDGAVVKSPLRKHLVPVVWRQDWDATEKQWKREKKIGPLLRHRMEEEEERPWFAFAPVANRLENRLHHLASRSISMSWTDQNYPKDWPLWMKRLVVLLGRKKRSVWSLLRGEISELTKQEEQQGLDAGTSRLFGEWALQTRDLEYDLRSNRWWDIMSHTPPRLMGPLVLVTDTNALEWDSKCTEGAEGGSALFSLMTVVDLTGFGYGPVVVPWANSWWFLAAMFIMKSISHGMTVEKKRRPTSKKSERSEKKKDK